MRALHTKANVNAAGGSYPYGRVRNNPGDNSGTHVDEELVGDLMQFFEKLMDDAGVAANGQPENSSAGFQLNTALATVISNATNPKLNKSGGIMSGDIDMATTHKIIHLPASSANGEAVRHEEIVDEATIRAGDDSALASAIFNATAGLLRTIVDIGDWNMDVDPFLTKAHGIADFKKIRAISAIVRNDTDTQYQPLNKVENATFTIVQGGISSFNSVNITLGRLASGDFDNASYDSTSFNRGWIIIDHTP